MADGRTGRSIGSAERPRRGRCRTVPGEVSAHGDALVMPFAGGRLTNQRLALMIRDAWTQQTGSSLLAA